MNNDQNTLHGRTLELCEDDRDPFFQQQKSSQDLLRLSLKRRNRGNSSHFQRNLQLLERGTLQKIEI